MARKVFILSILVWVLGGVCVQRVEAALPANFPAITAHVYDADAIGEGYVYVTVSGKVEGVGFYLMILNNDGVPVWYKELPHECAFDFKMQPNGLLTYAQLLERHSYADGGNAVHVVMNKDFAEVDTFQMANGYVADAHDFHWLSNGHALLFGYYLTEVELSEAALGGCSNAVVSGAVVQELNADREVVFEWRTWDHYDLGSHTCDGEDAESIVCEFPLNTLGMDVDGHLLIATPDWVKKISRQTGQILWHLGGDENEFTLVGVDAEEAVGHFGPSALHRLDNGNVLTYDSSDGMGTCSSQVHEYRLDEENRIAEHVWSYVPDPPVLARHGGNAQRLANGNTFIGWGGDGDNHGPVCTEVTPEGQKVFELFFDDPAVESYRAFRFPLPADITGVGVTKQYVGIGDNEFKRGGVDTGVTIRIHSYTGTGYNVMGVVRTPLAPLYPTFEGPAPQVVPVRLQVGANGINTINARLLLCAKSFHLTEPETYTVYWRNPKEARPFLALPTSYDPAAGTFCADMMEFGEFILGKPDLELAASAKVNRSDL
ncbi:MAG TPA: arylsulfotransferase family protein [Sedimentisphaerales bacterium]|nr:arylsulfotransferase family protein [Sedimentisphaerales bacterium]HRS12245.1 arylsulfotransferase family protein [Sedimentisphaerales bacterium]HRV48834.1 arylsulfotransferase family protein [Sedimentisphaerales bacterium]